MKLWYFNLCNSIFQMLPTEGSFDLKSKLRLIIERGKRFTHTVNSRSYISPGLIQVCKGFWVDLQTGGGGRGWGVAYIQGAYKRYNKLFHALRYPRTFSIYSLL